MADSIEVLRLQKINVVTVLCEPEDVQGKLNDTLLAYKIDVSRLISLQTIATTSGVLTVITFRD